MVDWNQIIKINLAGINIKRYKELGYVKEENKIGDIIEVLLCDVTKGSKSKVKVICDICGKEYEITRNNLEKILQQEDNRTVCKNCAHIKFKDIFQKKHGVPSPFLLEEVQEKIKDTCEERYGVDHPSKLKSVLEKRFETNLQKYGSISPFGNKEVIKKSKETLKKNYNVDNPSQSNEIQEKIRKSFNKNKTGISSKQQRTLQKYIGGQLNYPFKRYSLDLAYEKEKIDIEYNGGGHDLSVRMGNETETKFIQKEFYRKK